MLRIGEFSRVSRVPVKTLRYYDEIGLFRPRAVDDATGYRLYTAEQLPALHRILALKDLGFSLEQIAHLQTAASPAVIRAMLVAKRDELAARVREEQARLARVEARLRQIAGEDTMPTYDVIVKQVAPLRIAAVRETVRTIDDMAAFYRRLMDAIQGVAREAGWRPGGPWMALQYTNGYAEQDIDLELALPIAAPEDTAPGEMADGVQLRTLAETTVAATVHHGPYDRLGEAYAALVQWIRVNGYRLSLPSREVYLSGPDEPGEPVTEIEFAVER